MLNFLTDTIYLDVLLLQDTNEHYTHITGVQEKEKKMNKIHNARLNA